MAIAPNSSTNPSTPCIMSCQVSETSETSCAELTPEIAECGGPEICDSLAPGSGISAMCFEFASSDGSCRLPRRLWSRFQSCAREAYEAEIGGRLIFPCPARLFHGTEGDVQTIGLKFSQAKICRNLAGSIRGSVEREGSGRVQGL